MGNPSDFISEEFKLSQLKVDEAPNGSDSQTVEPKLADGEGIKEATKASLLSEIERLLLGLDASAPVYGKLQTLKASLSSFDGVSLTDETLKQVTEELGKIRQHNVVVAPVVNPAPTDENVDSYLELDEDDLLFEHLWVGTCSTSVGVLSTATNLEVGVGSTMLVAKKANVKCTVNFDKVDTFIASRSRRSSLAYNESLVGTGSEDASTAAQPQQVNTAAANAAEQSNAQETKQPKAAKVIQEGGPKNSSLQVSQTPEVAKKENKGAPVNAQSNSTTPKVETGTGNSAASASNNTAANPLQTANLDSFRIPQQPTASYVSSNTSRASTASVSDAKKVQCFAEAFNEAKQANANATSEQLKAAAKVIFKQKMNQARANVQVSPAYSL